MAENKKSVLLYCDIIHTVEELEDSDAGLLFKHYLRYINDQNPEPPSKLIKIVFEPIKQNLKRDLKKWEAKSVRNSESAKKRWSESIGEDANASERIKRNAKDADKDTVTVKVTDTVTVKGKGKKEYTPPSESDLIAYVIEKGFPESLGKKIFEYYSTADWHDANGKKVKNWKQKLLSVWLKEENKPKLTPQQLTDEETYKKNEEAANLWK